MSNGNSRDRAAAIAAILQHDFFVYDSGLNFCWSPSGEELLERLRRSRTYLVDNNVSWKPLARAHREVNFVIGSTVAEEANDLQGVLFSRMPAGGYANAFSVTLTAMDGVRIVFNRLEERYQAAAFARAIPILENSPLEHRANQLRAADSLRHQLTSNLSRASEDLRRDLVVHATRALSSYTDAGLAAMLATVLMLQGLSVARRRAKLAPGYLQLPGDTRLIAEALFYGFPILSNDVRDVHALGEIAGVDVTSEAEFGQASDGNPPIPVPTA